MTCGRRVVSRTIGLIATILLVAAIWEQLRLSPEERTWQGTIIGIPYDFRWPTVERIQEKVWNKNTSRILMPRIFGVGWTINLYPLVHFKAKDNPA
jgi:hypothetical protein